VALGGRGGERRHDNVDLLTIIIKYERTERMRGWEVSVIGIFTYHIQSQSFSGT